MNANAARIMDQILATCGDDLAGFMEDPGGWIAYNGWDCTDDEANEAIDAIEKLLTSPDAEDI